MTSVSSSPKTRRRMTMSPEHTAGNESWRPERETKAQRQWQRGQKKQRRSTKVLFASTVLLGEAFVIAFLGLMLFGLHKDDGGLWFLLGALVLSTITSYVAWFVATSISIIIGSVIQALVIASGFLEVWSFLNGILFALAWWYAVVKGKQIDADNVIRDQQQAQWEREHGTKPDTD